ncbi:MAG: putative rRNA methylase [Chlamydiales bacterium]|jgi:SAM-dependent methyltransferase|nr:putative rRNA methylase [Chlamydiales bacterium]
MKQRAFQQHIHLARRYWLEILQEGDQVIDATCGNGHDTLFLLQRVGLKGLVISYDIQEQAILSAKELLAKHGILAGNSQIRFIQGNHAQFAPEILPQTIKLIVYNLGYLPGGNKGITTSWNSTIDSLNSALQLLTADGMISVTLYPGHAEGKIEQEKVLEWVTGLDPKKWICCHHQWPNRTLAPSLLLISKHEVT